MAKEIEQLFELDQQGALRPQEVLPGHAASRPSRRCPACPGGLGQGVYRRVLRRGGKERDLA
ncbi:MAG: hypothetical protein ABIL11_05755 [Chloroflexota bacterium]